MATAATLVGVAACGTHQGPAATAAARTPGGGRQVARVAAPVGGVATGVLTARASWTTTDAALASSLRSGPTDGPRRTVLRPTVSRPTVAPAVFTGAESIAPPAPPGWVISAEQLRSHGLARSYLVARVGASPAGGSRVAAGPLPIVVVLHGRMMTPGDAERITGFLAVVGRAVVVYPAGYDQSWNAGYCCGGAHAASVDDVAFIEAVVRQVVTTHPGTSDRDVYLVGYSNGGRMAYRMACDDPGGFVGVAAVEAVSVSECRVTDPVPLLEVASTGDPLVSVVAGARPKHIAGHTEITVDALMATWRHLDGCSAVANQATYGDVTTTAWSHCAGASRVELAVYGGGSHAWPHGEPTTPSAQKVIWSFFHRAAPPSP